MIKLKSLYMSVKNYFVCLNKKIIVICDDHDEFIEDFRKIIKNEKYIIRSVPDIIGVEDEIKKIRTEYLFRNPDLVLLDLYHPCLGVNTTKADNQLEKLKIEIRKTVDAYENIYSPTGLEVLKDLRTNRKYSRSKLPIAIYTQVGFSMLKDTELSIIEENQAHWFLKKKNNPLYDHFRIKRILNDEASFQRKSNYLSTLFILFVVSFILIELVRTSFYPYIQQENIDKLEMVFGIILLVANIIENSIHKFKTK